MIIFMGVAGAGKSVQGRRLADEMGLPWLSTGEFLRMLISGERRKAMVAGKLLDDSEIIELVQKALSMIDSRDEEFIMDGFPRTLNQADWLLNQVKHDQLKVTAVFHFVASEETVRERLLQRGRQDDTDEAIQERFREYQEVTKPIIDEFKRAGLPVYDIDASQTVEDVYADIHEYIKGKSD